MGSPIMAQLQLTLKGKSQGHLHFELFILQPLFL